LVLKYTVFLQKDLLVRMKIHPLAKYNDHLGYTGFVVTLTCNYPGFKSVLYDSVYKLQNMKLKFTVKYKGKTSNTNEEENLKGCFYEAKENH